MMLYAIVISAVIARFIPHMPNFAPITALAIFTGANMDWKKSAGIVLAARFVSDLYLGFFAWPLLAAVYASHLAGVGLGNWIKNIDPSVPLRGTPPLIRGGGSAGIPARTRSFSSCQGGVPAQRGRWLGHWLKILGSSLAASALFFLVTNFAFLYASYPHNISGIILAYANGLPFLRGTLLGDLSYTVALFGVYELAKYLSSTKVSSKFLIPNS